MNCHLNSNSIRKISFLCLLILSIHAVSSTAQTPLWQGKGRIVISSDGNEHDHDDWAATPLSLAVQPSMHEH